MRRSRKELAVQVADHGARIEKLTEERDDALKGQQACASQLERVAGELSRGKDVIASHMVWVAHPSTVPHSPEACMEALREALAAVGFDLRLELQRLEGSDL